METKGKVFLGLLAAAAAGTGIYFATRKPSDEEVVRKSLKEVAPGEEDKVKKMSAEELKTVATAIDPKLSAMLASQGRGGGVLPGQGRGGDDNRPGAERVSEVTQTEARKNFGVIQKRAMAILSRHKITAGRG